MYDALRTLTDQHGIFLAREALEIGCDDKILRRGRRDGILHRVRHGAYHFADTWPRDDEAAQHVLAGAAVLRTARAPMVLSHCTALTVHEVPLWGVPRDRVHVTRLDGRSGRSGAGVVQHQGLVVPGDSVLRRGLPVTSVARAAVELSALTRTEVSLCVLDFVLNRGLATREELQEVQLRMEHWPGTLASDLAIRLADECRESVGESRTFYVMYQGGVPKAVPQLEIYDEAGWLLARLDFAWPDLGVWLEFDGREKYLKFLREGETVIDAVLREKKREERIAAVTGWRCIRITWADLHRPHATAAYIRNVLAGGPVHV
jgi:hypothetical protein